MSRLDKVLVFIIFGLVVAGAGINVHRNLSVDRSKIPEKVEEFKGFQRWITNLKNKGLTEIDADEFRLVEENEIYNTRWMKVFDFEDYEQEYWENIDIHRNLKKVIFSPSDRLYIDYRSEERDGYEANEVHFYGVRDDKIIDARVVDCSVRANCYFDRAYFLSNDVFVVSEFSRTIHKHDEESPACDIDSECIYSIKIHVIDLINNSRLVYESEPFDLVLSDWISKL
ncbi:hypothetical protein ACFL13_02425 [Patescibacteria group bacterium]